MQFPLVPSAIDIFKALQDIGSYESIGGKSWFKDWKLGKILIDVDYKKIESYLRHGYRPSLKVEKIIKNYYRRYCGATWSTWERWALLGMSSKEINNILEIGEHAIMPIYAREGGYKNVQKTARKRVTMDLLALGVDPLTIYYKTFGHSLQASANDKDEVYFFIRDFFETLFDNTMSYDEIVNHHWTYEGWVDFYSLKSGINY